MARQRSRRCCRRHNALRMRLSPLLLLFRFLLRKLIKRLRMERPEPPRFERREDARELPLEDGRDEPLDCAASTLSEWSAPSRSSFWGKTLRRDARVSGQWRRSSRCEQS